MRGRVREELGLPISMGAARTKQVGGWSDPLAILGARSWRRWHGIAIPGNQNAAPGPIGWGTVEARAMRKTTSEFRRNLRLDLECG